MAIFGREEGRGYQGKTNGNADPDRREPRSKRSLEILSRPSKPDQAKRNCQSSELAGISFNVEDEVVYISTWGKENHYERRNIVDYKPTQRGSERFRRRKKAGPREESLTSDFLVYTSLLVSV